MPPTPTEGLLAPLALPGTVFPDGFILEETAIRGEASEGMLCSQAELGLGIGCRRVDDSGSRVSRRQAFRARFSVLSDPVLEIDLTPNSAGLSQHLGNLP